MKPISLPAGVSPPPSAAGDGARLDIAAMDLALRRPSDTVPPPGSPEQVQALYCELLHSAHRHLRTWAESGEEQARLWLERFIVLGEHLGVQLTGRPENTAAAETAAVARLVQEAWTARRVPTATYRLQFHRDFTFRDALDVVDYLHTLGVGDCYASPLLQACAGSSHGYDICDHTRLNPELGSEQDFDAFAAALQARGMGLILDAVPNHMGIADSRNAWWMDVLENGPSSAHAPFFDINWQPVNPDLHNKVLLPFLGDQYGRVLEAGSIRLIFEEGSFFLVYYRIKLPVAPCTYPVILEHRLPELVTSLGEVHEHVRELRSILTALRYLPPRTESSPAKVVERGREKEVIKRRLAALYRASVPVRDALDATLTAFNGTVGDPRSFDALNALIDQQAYRPAYWRVATEEINYRRFFDINELAAIRMELPEVFRPTHALLIRLLAEGKATGLRIDHPDGLWNPASYFGRLQETYLLERVRAALPAEQSTEDVAREVAARLEEQRKARQEPAGGPLYVVAEKILSEGEPLPPDWAVDGTTGYDFLNAVNGLFVAAEDRDAIDRIYQEFTRSSTPYPQLVNSTKKMIMLVSMASEINALAYQLDRIAERNRHYRDFTLNSLTFAIREVIACQQVYRTYITGPESVSRRDRLSIEAAVEEAKRRNPRTAEAVFDFLRDTLLLANVNDFAAADRPQLIEWAMKFQQLTGPIMAKGAEDTVFYVYNRLVSLNEVGGSPDQFGVSVAAFHRQNAERLARWPDSLLATSTHDTKRSEDVRARLNVLSELPGEWQAALGRWKRLNSGKKHVVEDQPAPDANDEYLLYQTLLGAWPAEPLTEETQPEFVRRIGDYMRKATREAKVHTSWINPNEEYEGAIGDFVNRLLSPATSEAFLTDLLALQRRMAFFGYVNSLSQIVLKMTSPGVPDFYQGSELWDFSLVDPDNRRPVDYRRRRAVLAELRARIDSAGPDLLPLAKELLDEMPDGRIKSYLIHRTLTFRREFSQLFARGSYLPLEGAGLRRDHLCAFARSNGEDAVLVAVPRLVVRLTGGEERLPLGPEVWNGTWLALQPQLANRTYRNLYTGEVLTPGQQNGVAGLALAEVFRTFPMAVLTSVEADPAR